MMKFFAFWWECLCVSFSDASAFSGYFALAVAGALLVFKRWNNEAVLPRGLKKVQSHADGVALSVLVASLVFISPYKVYLGEKQRADKAEAALKKADPDALQAQIDELRALLERSKPSKPKFPGLTYNEGKELATRLKSLPRKFRVSVYSTAQDSYATAISEQFSDSLQESGFGGKRAWFTHRVNAPAAIILFVADAATTGPDLDAFQSILKQATNLDLPIQVRPKFEGLGFDATEEEVAIWVGTEY